MHRLPRVFRSDVSRRAFLKSVAATAAMTGITPLAWAKGRTGLMGLSIFGELKYGPDAKHLDYVNPNAPKGGTIKSEPQPYSYNQNPETFDTFNGHTFKGNGLINVENIYDTLLGAGEDEADAAYGYVAKTIDVSEDGNEYTFHLRTEARFHDGVALTSADVKWSLDTLRGKLAHPTAQDYLSEIEEVIAVDPATVTIRYNGKQRLQDVFLAGGMPIFPKHYWEGRDFAAATLEVPLGGSSYKIGRFDTAKFVEFHRVPDHWAKGHWLTVGQGNFDVIRFDFFRDRTAEFEAFKKGDIDVRTEGIARQWKNAYDFPAVKDGRVKKLLFPGNKRPTLYGWLFNLRRERFADARTREALNLALDFEWSNRNIFTNAYVRNQSFFENSDFAASGPLPDAERALLEPYKDQLPETVFGEAPIQPISDGSGRDRKNLRKATQLLKEAGWSRKGGALQNDKGEKLTLEFLVRSETFNPFLGGWIEALKLIGVEATIRQVDPSQYQERLKNHDFDCVALGLLFSTTPLTNLSNAFGSVGADQPDSFNLAGIKNPALDGLIETVTQSKSREELTIAIRAIDRVLRAYHYAVLSWNSPNRRVAVWDKFGWPDSWPDKKPAFGFPVNSVWWIDKEKEAKLKRG